MFDAGHEGGHVPLGFRLDGLHFLEELWPGCQLNTIVDLEVNEIEALEGMVFIADASGGTEATQSEFPGCLGMTSQFKIKAVV